ncbi:WD40-repeat-containing domain protein [Entophlyctis helioformis]|nr:WD40-repeat-containing domain protein [Entophlyctis helioformis]
MWPRVAHSPSFGLLRHELRHAMFASSPASAVVDVPSSWRRDKTFGQSSCQTEPLSFGDKACLTVQLSNIQTDPEPQPARRQLNPSEIDYPALVSFLARAEPAVSTQLLQNVKSTAFHGYTVKWEDEVDSISCPFTLQHAHRPDADMSCTDLAWNMTGSVVATSYGHIDHSGWCAHKGMICAWNIALRDINPDIASFAAETSSCLMSIAFHPETPSLVAGGTFNGEIIVWTTAADQQDPVVASSKPSDLAHQEPICRVAWIASDRRGKYDLVSVGNDGKILFWDLANDLVSPKAVTQILYANIPRSLKPTTATTLKFDVPVGATSVAFSKLSPHDFFLGTEAGHVFKCTSQHAAQIAPKQREQGSKAPSPIQFAYASHVGPVQTIAHSPFHRNLFLTCGTDGNVRLYNQLQPKPLLTWEPSSQALCSVDWSPSRPPVFACTTIEGNILIYDLSASRTAPSVILNVNDDGRTAGRTNASPGSTLQSLQESASRTGSKAALSSSTNPNRPASGVWRLSTQLSIGGGGGGSSGEASETGSLTGDARIIETLGNAA